MNSNIKLSIALGGLILGCWLLGGGCDNKRLRAATNELNASEVMLAYASGFSAGMDVEKEVQEGVFTNGGQAFAKYQAGMQAYMEAYNKKYTK